jgi:multiple sugar transport system substrate-binding protein
VELSEDKPREEEMAYRGILKLTVAALLAAGASAANAAPILFWSSQGTPVEEQQRIRDNVLKAFGDVDFQPQDPGPYVTRIQAEAKAGSGAIGVIGGLDGDFASFPDALSNVGDLATSLASLKINQNYLALGKLGGSEQKYIPWMQATYIMAANKKALPFLPAGADINALTYDQLIAWGKNLAEKTGGPKIGIPAGPKGLIHRFFQGHLYPSFTKSEVTKFRSPEAVAMWQKMKDLWAVTSPASTNYGFMQEQLLSEEVWVAWDHVARLGDAFNQKPNDFVAFPVPAGPAGRGFMPVVAGLAIPKTSPDMEQAKKLVAYMLQPSTQIAMVKANGFYPVVAADIPADAPPAVKAEAAAVAAQTSSKDALVGMLPVGLGANGGKFNKVYTDTFQQIVLNNADIKKVLDEQAAILAGIMKDSNAPCWAPDVKTAAVCPVE